MKLSLRNLNRIKPVLIPVFLFIGYFSYSQVAKVTVEDLKMDYYDKDSSAGAVILFDIGSTDLDMIHNDFVMKFTRHIRIKLFNESEMNWADVEIPFYYEKIGNKESVKIKSAVTYNLVNGDIEKTVLDNKSFIEEETSDYYKQLKFAFANVRQGSIIEYEYEIQSPYKQPKKWYFQYSIPVKYSEYNAELASFWQYKTLLRGFETPVIDTSYVKLRVGTCSFTDQRSKVIKYQYHKAISNIVFEDVPAFHYEEYMKCAEDYISKVEFQLTKYVVPGLVERNILKTWEEVASEYYDRFELNKNVKIFPELKAKLSDQTLSTEGKTKLILRYVQKNYTWNGQNSITSNQESRILQKTKIGNSADLNLHLIRLLRQSGVSAYPIILSTSSNGRVHYELPFIRQFNYILPLVADEKGGFFCDATLNCAPYYLIPSKCLNGHGFLVDTELSQFVELEDISQTYSDYFVLCKFNPEMDSVTMKVNMKAFGYDALRVREFLLEEEHERVTDILFPTENDIEFEYEVNIKEDNYNEPLSLSFILKKEVWIRNDKIYFNPFICENITENPFNSTERKFPIDFRYKRRKKNLITIVIPQGCTLESFPDAKFSSTASNAVKYNFAVQNHGVSAQVMVLFEVENPVVDAEDYLDLKDIYNDMIRTQSEYFVISKSD